MYAAEGSDWFWWYGGDQTAPGGDRPFDEAFRTHLRNVYTFAALAGKRLPDRQFPSILEERADSASPRGQTGGGTMSRGSARMRTVVIECDARAEHVSSAIFIAGSESPLGNWNPNTVAMRDDGAGGDAIAGDGIWTLTVSLPVGLKIQYKFTNSGQAGKWVPGEEFPSRNRSLVVEEGEEKLIVRCIFGK
jgi:hypothetical protein